MKNNLVIVIQGTAFTEPICDGEIRISLTSLQSSVKKIKGSIAILIWDERKDF